MSDGREAPPLVYLVGKRWLERLEQLIRDGRNAEAATMVAAHRFHVPRMLPKVWESASPR